MKLRIALLVATLLFPLRTIADAVFLPGGGSGSLPFATVPQLASICTTATLGAVYNTLCVSASSCASAGAVPKIAQCSGAGTFTYSPDGAAGAGDGVPQGSGNELQYRVNGTTFGALGGTTVSGSNLVSTGEFDLSRVQINGQACLKDTTTDGQFIDFNCDGLFTNGSDRAIQNKTIKAVNTGSESAGLREALFKCPVTGGCTIELIPGTHYDLSGFTFGGSAGQREVLDVCDCVDDDLCENNSDVAGECRDIYFVGAQGAEITLGIDPARCTGSGTPFTCCTSAGVGATCDYHPDGTIGPVTFKQIFRFDNVDGFGMSDMRITLWDMCNDTADSTCPVDSSESYVIEVADNGDHGIIRNNYLSVFESNTGSEAGDDNDFNQWFVIDVSAGGETGQSNLQPRGLTIEDNEIYWSSIGIGYAHALPDGYASEPQGVIVRGNHIYASNRVSGSTAVPTKCAAMVLNGYSSTVSGNEFNMQRNNNDGFSLCVAMSMEQGSPGEVQGTEDVGSGLVVTDNHITHLGLSQRAIRIVGVNGSVISDNVIQAGQCSHNTAISCIEDGECGVGNTCDPTAASGIWIANSVDRSENSHLVITGNNFGMGPNADGGFNDTDTVAPIMISDAVAGVDPLFNVGNIIAFNTWKLSDPTDDGFANGVSGGGAAQPTAAMARHQIFANGPSQGTVPFWSGIALKTTPAQDDALTQVLVRATDGTVKFRSSATLGGAGVSDGDKTDITVSGTGTIWNIDASTVGTSEITDGTVASADLTDNTITATDIASTVTFIDGDFLDLSAINGSGTGEGLKLPQAAACTSSTGEGQICWDTDGDFLSVGTGAGVTTFGGSGGWTDTGTVVTQATNSDDLVIGGAAADDGAKMTLILDENEPGFSIQMNASQTADSKILAIETSGDSDVWSVDAEGDMSANSITMLPSASPRFAFVDDTTDDEESAAITADCTDTGTGAEDCDVAIQVREAGAALETRIAIDADGGITLGAAANNSLTVTTDGTGDGEVVLPNASISSTELNDTVGNILLETEIDASSELLALMDDETGTGLLVFATTPTIATPVLTGKIDRNNVAVDDDDCTGDQGNMWYDTTDSAFEFCDANTGAPNTIIAAAGDVTAVGDCGTSACFTGASGTILTSTTSDTVNMATDATFKFTRNDAGAVTITSADNDANADIVYDAGGTGNITVGSADVTSITLVTDGISISEADLSIINDALIQFIEVDSTGTLGAPTTDVANSVFFATTGLIFEGATTGANELLLVAADPGADVTVTLPAATDTLIGKATADVLTNKTYDADAGTGNVLTMSFASWIPAAGCNNVTASLLMDAQTSGAATAACVTDGANSTKGVADFIDVTDASLQFTYKLPQDWVTGVDVNYRWFDSGTSTNPVVWCTELVCVGNGATDTSAFPGQGAGNCVSDAGLAGANQLNDAQDLAITATGCDAGEIMHVRISRDPDQTSGLTDTNASTARLIGVEIVTRRTM